MSLKIFLSSIQQFLAGHSSNKGPVRLLSFRILYLCIFLPPVLYIFSLQGLEKYLHHSWNQELKQNLIQNQQDLQLGNLRLEDEVKNNIKDFRESRQISRLGLEFQIIVRSAKGKLIYPDYTFQDRLLPGSTDTGKELLVQLQKNLQALENQRLLQQGLVIHLAVQIPRNTWLANIVLLFYIFVFSSMLYFSYQSRVRASEIAAQAQQQELEHTRQRLFQERQHLEQAKQQQTEVQKQVEELQNRLLDADSKVNNIEEEALAELEALEQQLAITESERQAREYEIQELALKLEGLESAQPLQNKKQEKQQALYAKRFQTLYKNLALQERALQGFAQLSEDWKLKAEEVMYYLNSDPDLVSIKRKVFTRGSVSAWETEFAHKGRLYWRKTPSGKIEILALGSKNTQIKDLKYLESITD